MDDEGNLDPRNPEASCLSLKHPFGAAGAVGAVDGRWAPHADCNSSDGNLQVKVGRGKSHRSRRSESDGG